jgi:hypothetical protein
VQVVVKVGLMLSLGVPRILDPFGNHLLLECRIHIRVWFVFSFFVFTRLNCTACSLLSLLVGNDSFVVYDTH